MFDAQERRIHGRQKSQTFAPATHFLLGINTPLRTLKITSNYTANLIQEILSLGMFRHFGD